MHLVHMRQLFQRLREADLKLNREKCSFFKNHIQYLEHLISGEGIKPLPEKLESIKEMPPPTTPKEVKQFLGLIGYYRKFVPRFADVARPLTNLTRPDQPFEWSDKYQTSFELLKEALIKEPILRFPDQNKPYTLYTDASKYAWSCVLTQQYTHNIDNKQVVVNHPITYISGLFKGSQLNWAALTKEAYAIYMSIKKLMIGTVYPNIPLSSASLHGHPQSSLGATLGVRMSTTAYGNHSTVSSVWPIGAPRLNLRPRPLSI